MATKTIKVDYLARVEGEGALLLRIRDGEVEEAQLKIFEPPRFFEAFLRGRAFAEAPDLTARICGICPVAYQMSAAHAMERACGVGVSDPVRELRRLLYCGEWIESHALHIFMLHAPDFLKVHDAVALARLNPELVRKGLALKKTGNALMSLIGGREIHPINVRLGGFYKIPAAREFAEMAEQLKRARDLALETVRWTAALPFPDFRRDYEFVALRHPSEYPFNEGRIVSSRGLDIPVEEYEAHFTEEHVERSNALHSVLRGTDAYFVGPMARFNLNFDRLPSLIQEAAREAGVLPPCNNPFQSIVIRALETLYSCEEAIRIIEGLRHPVEPSVPVPPRAGVGHAATEAPRGLIYHRYRIDERGTILDAKIVPPTSQNQKTIEADLMAYAAPRIELPEEELTWQCEQAIRNYDPCISCATHFLKLHLDKQ